MRITTQHSEGRSLTYITDETAPIEDQPAVVVSYDPLRLHTLPTLAIGPHEIHHAFDNLKIDTGSIRVWVSRIDATISVEQLVGGRWVLV